MMDTIQARVEAARSAEGPKYLAVRDAILGAITSGEWKPGMRLPTEAELSKLLPYSLGTIQKAYGELVKDGVVVRERGRGSFIAPAQRQMAGPWHCRFLDDDGTVLPIYPRFAGHRRAKPEKRWVRLFGPKAEMVQIDRVISINHEFDVFSRFFAPDTIANALLALPRRNIETANFKAILLRELGLPISRIVQTIVRADKPPMPRQRWRPQLLLEATAYASGGEAAYFQEIHIPAIKRKLLFDSDLRG
jgi:GntR family transcriptional regulator